MKYQQGSFTLPAGPPSTSQRKWDYSVMNQAKFVAKYGEHSPEPSVPTAPSK
jgi:hypothetical protein